MTFARIKGKTIFGSTATLTEKFSMSKSF